MESQAPEERSEPAAAGSEYNAFTTAFVPTTVAASGEFKVDGAGAHSLTMTSSRASSVAEGRCPQLKKEMVVDDEVATNSMVFRVTALRTLK
ncbi:hypothetical protein AINA4_01500 [Aurantimicrobium sp. INA4]|nr:hypothetical protein AINA4_01500 [Aurantimicrobium sp. INA4]